MAFQFTRNGLSPKEAQLERFLEILPGFLSWLIIIGLMILGFTEPLTAALIIIAFDLFWFLRLIYVTIFLILSYGRLAIEAKTDWMARIAGMDEMEDYIKIVQARLKKRLSLKERISLGIHLRDIKQLKKTNVSLLKSTDIIHFVIFPVLKEGRDIIERSIKGLLDQRFPLDRIVVAIALEERASAAVKADCQAVVHQYRDRFRELAAVIHPSGLPDEARVKGANITFAARHYTEYFRKHQISLEHIIVSCFDADTVVSKDYFGCLTYQYLIYPNRTRASFQPVPVYNNNLWETHRFTRVVEMGSSFFQLIEATNREKLVTFSSHSMSFKALVEVGYWPVDIISDDSAIFWKAFLHYEGAYQAVPMYVTLSMDAVIGDYWWQTFKNIYKQRRRWAWGVESFPIVIRGFLQSKKISLYDKIRYGFKLLEGHISWATWPFILSLVGWIPIIFTTREFSSSVLYYNAPRITATIFHLSSISLLITIILSLYMLPEKRGKTLRQRIGFAFEWLSIPVILIFLSAVPALDAQTRLMLGRYMEFWVTDKKALVRR